MMNDNLLDNKRIERILNNPDLISELKIEEINEIISRANDILKNEPNIVKLNHKKNDLYIGDIHGKFESIKAIQKLIQQNNYQYYGNIVFLGDYVDRGPRQVDSINYVLLLKIQFPNKVFLLRGNHETVSMNKSYGFYNLILREFDESIYNSYKKIYGSIPLATSTDTGVLAIHGGVPENIPTLRQLDRIDRFTADVDFDDLIFMQLLWNDPTNRINDFSSSLRGGPIKVFGKKPFQKFLAKNNIKLVIRAHEAFMDGYKFFFDNQLLSIFSAANYRGDNDAKVAKITPKLKVSLISLV
ncbi:MAG: hypothetical protein GF329_20535 [Candidatus Lokiarchaeota archaeon]|nr:hypothetical protein [Candidatus Lokiarchaeota archaeon]